MQLTIKPQNYIQVVLKDTVSPDYIAFFYNTDKGRAIRDDYAVGETILHHSLQSIKKLPIILPEEDIQKEFLKTESEIYRLEIEVERLRQKFLVSPAAYKTIRRDMKNVNNHEDALERWISQLPYPLSTILRKYIVDDSYEKKQETLFYFFEAYSQFLATILTSVIANHKELFVKNHIFRNTSYTHYEKASFGNWVILNQMIIKEMNRTLATLEGKSVVYEAFGTSERDLLELLCNKDVCNILYEVSQQRNSWKGHTGITSALDYEEHVRKLHDSLLQIQLRTKDLFERIQLIRSTSLKYTRKRYIHTIEILTGSDPLFKKAEFVSDYPLDSEKLYIQYMGSESTIELIPMIIFGSSPASSKSACYFYNRVENGNTRYVSYHYEGQPEDIESGMSAFEIIKEMMA